MKRRGGRELQALCNECPQRFEGGGGVEAVQLQRASGVAQPEAHGSRHDVECGGLVRQRSAKPPVKRAWRACAATFPLLWLTSSPDP